MLKRDTVDRFLRLTQNIVLKKKSKYLTTGLTKLKSSSLCAGPPLTMINTSQVFYRDEEASVSSWNFTVEEEGINVELVLREFQTLRCLVAHRSAFAPRHTFSKSVLLPKLATRALVFVISGLVCVCALLGGPPPLHMSKHFKASSSLKTCSSCHVPISPDNMKQVDFCVFLIFSRCG